MSGRKAGWGSRVRRAWGAILTFALSTYGLPLAAAPAPAKSTSLVKVRVSNASVASRLVAEGAQNVGSYGAFSILRVESTEAARLVAARLAELTPQDDSILLNVGAIDTRSPELAAQRNAAASFEGRRLHLVQFAGPIRPEWYKGLEATGVDIVQYIPSNAYLVYGDAGAVGRTQDMARSSSAVQWDGAYLDRYKVQPAAEAGTRAKLGLPADRDQFTVQLVKDTEANAVTVGLVQQRATAPLRSQWEILKYVNLVVTLPLAAVAEIAARPDVVSIDRFVEPQKFDERQDRIVSGQLAGNAPAGGDYLAYLATKGFTQAQFTTSNFVVDLTDSGIDNATASPNHFGLHLTGSLGNPGRILYNRLLGTPNVGQHPPGLRRPRQPERPHHRRLRARPRDPSGSRSACRRCVPLRPRRRPLREDRLLRHLRSRHLHVARTTRTCSRAPTTTARASRATAGVPASNAYYRRLAGATTRSCATRSPPAPRSRSRATRRWSSSSRPATPGPGANTTGSPGTAKNVITVGASEASRPFGGADQCGVADTGADSANDIVDFSSRGPTSDGRSKPDIVAPGTHVSGGRLPGRGHAQPAGTGRGERLLHGHRRVRRAGRLELLPDDPAVLHRLVRHQPLHPGRWPAAPLYPPVLHQQRPARAEPGHDQGVADELRPLHDRRRRQRHVCPPTPRAWA